MENIKLFPKQIPLENIAKDITNAIETVKSLPPEKYNINLFRGLAVGFKSLLYAMDKDRESEAVYPLFLKWFKLYVTLQHQIDSKDPLRLKFESKIPVCTSYILASLQYQNNIANYHQNIMEMCLLLFKSAKPYTMQNIANLDIDLIGQLWMPVGFVGDYITQRLCLKLIVTILKHLSAEQRQSKVSAAKLDKDIERLVLKLSADPTNFEQLSRELLNIYNVTFSRNCTVFSVYCTKAIFGRSELFKPENASNFWIDFNYTSNSVSLLCQLNQSDRKQEEFYIKIKIDKLQIENQFDCYVYTNEEGSFSGNVSEQLLSARVAVFTLPKNQLERLKANSDLMDYYNTYSYYESSAVSTPNTIMKYLADLSVDSPMTPYSEDNYDTPRMKSARVKIHKFDDVKIDCQSIQNESITLGFENNSTAKGLPLVSRVEYLPNYVGPSIKRNDNNTNTTATEQPTIFKKPTTPIKFKKRNQIKSLTEKTKETENKIEKTTKLEGNKSQNKIINSSYSKKETKLTPTNNKEQKHSSSMPSEREQLQTNRLNGSKIKRDEVSLSFTSIQVSRSSFERFFNATTKRSVKEQNYEKVQQKLIEENSLLEISHEEICNGSKSTTSNTNEETTNRNTIDGNNYALSVPESSQNVIQLHSNKSETPEKSTISTPIQASVVPIQRSPKKNDSHQLSQKLEISDNHYFLTQKMSPNPHKERSDTICANKSPIIYENSSPYPDSENHVTSSQISNIESLPFSQKPRPSKMLPEQIVINKNSSDTTIRSSNCEHIASELPKDRGRRFFKYKNLPSISSTTITKANRKARKKKSNEAEIQPKTKSVNLVKPLNYVTDLRLNINKSVSEPLENENCKHGEYIVTKNDEAYFSNEKNKAVHVSNINNNSNNNTQDFIPKSTKRRASKRKTLLKEVEVSNFVPYSIWKINQKEKNNVEPIALSPKPKPQRKTTSDTEPPRPSENHFDKIKDDITSRNQTNIDLSNRRSSSSSDTIRTCYFSESENEMESPMRNKPRNSLNRYIVRREEPSNSIQSPITVPYEKVEMRTKSLSRESILTPIEMSLASDCLDVFNSSAYRNEYHPLLESRTINLGSPVYEDLDDDAPNDPLQCDTTSQSPKANNPFLQEYHKEVSPTAKDLSDSEKKNQERPISPDTLSLESQQPDRSLNNNSERESVSLLPAELKFVEDFLQTLSEERTTSSRGSPVSVYSQDQSNEQEPYTNQVVIRTNNVVSSVRKRMHSPEDEQTPPVKIPALTNCTPLRNYNRLLPEFVEKLTTEKDRILKSINNKFDEDIFKNFKKTVDEVTKVINIHQAAIKEEQTKLLSTLENLEWHHKILLEHQSELEKIHGQIMELKQTCDQKRNTIDEIYREAEEVFISQADVIRKDQWHSFSESIINSVNERLVGYLNL